MAEKSPSSAKAATLPAKPRQGAVGAAVAHLLADPFRLVVALAVNAAIVVGIVATAIILHNHKPPPKAATMQAALGALDRGNAQEARTLAERLAAKPDITNEEWGTPDYIQGILAANAAEAAAGKERVDAFRTAALYLQRSRERGLPANRQGMGLYLLGKSLCRCGRLDDALPALEEALGEPNCQQEAEVRGLLIEALVGVYPPEFEKALAQSEKQLANPQLDDDAKREVMLQRAQIFVRTNRLKDASAALDNLPDNPLYRGQIALLRGRVALAEGQSLAKASGAAKAGSADAKAKFRLAVEWLRKAIAQDIGDNRVARQANYLIGLSLAEEGDLPAAMAQFERTEKLYAESPEVTASLFQQAEIARRMGRHSEAVAAYQRLVAAYSRSDEFHNQWISLPQMQTSIQSACRDYLKSEAYESALLLSRLLGRLIPKPDALALSAEIYRTWGDNLMEEAEHLSPERAERRRKDARIQLRHAGDTYGELAQDLFATRRYPDELWNAAGAYLAGHDFRSAVRTLRAYINNESKFRNAQALADLGEAELSLGEMEPALRAFQECIQQHPRDVAIYRARLLASRAAIASGNLKQAEGFLLDNLSGEQLTPASKEWRDSLFALGDLLHVAGRDADAIPRLEEALERYPDAPQAVTARYLLADSSRRLALTLRAGLPKEISSALRSERGEASNRHLRRALELYAKLQNDLGRRDAEDLAKQDKAVLRNARFALGDVYFALDRYPEALRAYQSAANHYASRPEALDAYLQIANVYRRMDRPTEARTSLEQARIALRRMPPDARFDKTTNFSRKQWGELLDRLCSL